MSFREQNEAPLGARALSVLAGTVDQVREMLARLAQPQRAAVARGLDEGVLRLEHAVGKLRGYIDENKTNG